MDFYACFASECSIPDIIYSGAYTFKNMMNSVLSYTKRVLYNLYYAFYILFEGLLKVSLSWAPIISITGVMSLLVILPLISLNRIASLCWANWDIPTSDATIFGILIWIGMYWLTYHYYLSKQKLIECRFQNDNIYKSILWNNCNYINRHVFLY